MREAGKNRDAALDGLRGLAALAVFVHHVWGHQLGSTTRPLPNDLTGWAANELRLSVPLFFMLSGLLIYRGFLRGLRAEKGLRLATYLKRRAARILPAYYVAIAGALLLLWGSTIPGLGLPPAGGLPLFAVLGQNYASDTFLTLDSPTWTLCVEAAFYLFLPLVLLPFARTRAGWRSQALVVAAVFAAGVAWHVRGVLTEADVIWVNALPTFLPYFAAGMAVALWAEHRPSLEIGRAASAAMAVAGIGVLVAVGAYHATHIGDRTAELIGDTPSTLGFVLLTVVGLKGSGLGLAWMRSRPLVFMGVISYGFYLWHLPLIFFLRGIYPHGEFVMTFVLAFPLAVGMGVLSWRLVEQPFIRLASRRREKRRVRDRPARRPAPYRPSSPRPASQASG